MSTKQLCNIDKTSPPLSPTKKNFFFQNGHIDLYRNPSMFSDEISKRKNNKEDFKAILTKKNFFL